jgi:hypothetical protein
LPAANIIVLIFSFKIDCFSVGTVKYNQISKFVKIKKRELWKNQKSLQSFCYHHNLKRDEYFLRALI